MSYDGLEIKRVNNIPQGMLFNSSVNDPEYLTTWVITSYYLNLQSEFNIVKLDTLINEVNLNKCVILANKKDYQLLRYKGIESVYLMPDKFPGTVLLPIINDVFSKLEYTQKTISDHQGIHYQYKFKFNPIISEAHRFKVFTMSKMLNLPTSSHGILLTLTEQSEKDMFENLIYFINQTKTHNGQYIVSVNDAVHKFEDLTSLLIWFIPNNYNFSKINFISEDLTLVAEISRGFKYATQVINIPKH